MSKPLLSIGMIFKNEIRCLERCLKSLQPLRETLPCELVMADTGSDDGSREIAERYADILIDFPWVNDFSAARNAVLDRCSGQWHLHIDADEWLDGDFSELAAFLRNGKGSARAGTVVVRNYLTPDTEGEYRDFYALRLVRLTAKLRFHGAIHEHFLQADLGSPMIPLRRVILRHDGYALESEERKKEKNKRNMALLRKELEKKPENLRLLLQFLESGHNEPDFLIFLRSALLAIERRAPGWKTSGPPILRYAVFTAVDKKLPELETWAAQAEEWFPDSFFTRLDVECILFDKAWADEDYEQCIRRGERYLQAMGDNRAGRGDQDARLHSTLMMESPRWERQIRIFLAGAYLRASKGERAADLLNQVSGRDLNAEQTKWFVLTLQDLHSKTMYDTAPLVSAFWEQVSEPKPTQKLAEERKNAVYGTAFNVFMSNPKDKRAQKEDRRAYTLYLPLRDKCELGRAAAVLETEDTAEMAGLLSQVERWDALPIQALARALDNGVNFPPPDKTLNLDEMDELAERLAADKETFFPLMGRVLSADFTANGQTLLWARSLSMTAVRFFDWDAENADIDTGLSVVRSFVQTEKAFLPLCYTPQVLREESLYALPPLHRFGWYCVRAFEAMDSGDAVSCLRLLRFGLGVCKSVKAMVEFLLKHIPELQTRPEPSAEMLALADRIRMLLTNFAPDDPAVAALKRSAAYQKVAYLIEGTGTTK